MISFILHTCPKAQARPRFARSGHAYKDKSQQLAEESLCALLLPYRPPAPLEDALCLSVKAYLPVPKSWSKKKQQAARQGDIKPTGKPDLDNLVKHLKDCLTVMNFWKDDALITEYTDITKHYDDGNGPRWEVMISFVNQKETKTARVSLPNLVPSKSRVFFW